VQRDRPILWKAPVLIAEGAITIAVLVFAIRFGQSAQTQLRPTDEVSDQRNDADVTAALQTSLRTQDINSEVFTAPTTRPSDDHWDFGGGANTALDWANWSGSAGVLKRLSYDYHNPYPDASSYKKR
jgi:hypothetical protein